MVRLEHTVTMALKLCTGVGNAPGNKMLRFDRRCKGNSVCAQQINEQVVCVNFAPHAKVEHNRIYRTRLNKVNHPRVNNPAQFMTHPGRGYCHAYGAFLREYVDVSHL